MMDLHGQIMNLRREKYPHNLNREDVLMAYRMGYRDARHDAAELALPFDALADAARALLALAESDSSTDWNVALCRLRDALAAG